MTGGVTSNSLRNRGMELSQNTRPSTPARYANTAIGSVINGVVGSIRPRGTGPRDGLRVPAH